MTFALGGLAFWMPAYLIFRHQPAAIAVPAFGGITVVAGLLSTLLGGFLADRLRAQIPGSYFFVSGLGMLLAFPLFIATIYAPFPLAWVCLFFAVFFVFLNTGPSNAALANVAAPNVRATAFALNILIIHLFGDAISPPLLGFVAGHDELECRVLHRVVRDLDFRHHLAARNEVSRPGHFSHRADRDGRKRKQQEQRNRRSCWLSS